MFKKNSTRTAAAVGIIGGISEETLRFLKARGIKYKLVEKSRVKILKIYRGLFKSTKYYFDIETGNQIKKK